MALGLEAIELDDQIGVGRHKALGGILERLASDCTRSIVDCQRT